MTIDDYQRQASRTMNWGLTDWENKMHALHGMVSELGEIHGIYQKVYQGHEDTETHTKREVGDLMWFVAEFCTANGWSLGAICEMNIEKLKNRYPLGFDAERSRHREAGDI